MTSPNNSLSRRHIAKGALWTVPVVAVSTATPAFAATCVQTSHQFTWPAPSSNQVTSVASGQPNTLTLSYGGSSDNQPRPEDGTTTADAGVNYLQLFRRAKINTALPPTTRSYEKVTFSFKTAVCDLSFTIRDIDAQTGSGNTYTDLVAVNSTSAFTSSLGSGLSGTGTLSNPFRPTSLTSNPWLSSANDATITFAGPVSSFDVFFWTDRGTNSPGVNESHVVVFGPLTYKTCCP